MSSDVSAGGVLERLLPRRADMDYRGSPIAFWAFCLFMLPMIFRGLVHFLKDDSGVQSIATIVTFQGTPDPNNVVYLYSSLWGSQQLLMVGVYLLVIFRYRNLLPLMWAIVVVEVVMRMVSGTLHPLTADYYLRTPPGKLLNLPLLALAGVMLVLSLGRRGEAAPQDRAAT